MNLVQNRKNHEITSKRHNRSNGVNSTHLAQIAQWGKITIETSQEEEIERTLEVGRCSSVVLFINGRNCAKSKTNQETCTHPRNMQKQMQAAKDQHDTNLPGRLSVSVASPMRSFSLSGSHL